MNRVARMIAIQRIVTAAFRASGSRKAGTPLEIASTPVSAVHPEAKARRALKRPRPGHADLAGALKYVTDDLRSVLERASARETASRVAAGALVRGLLDAAGVRVRSHVVRIGSVELEWGDEE